MTLFFLRLLAACIARLPAGVSRLLAAALGDLVYGLIPGRRHALLSNLHHAFPERPHAWHVRIARRSCRQMIETALIAIANPAWSLDRIREIVRPSPELARHVAELKAQKRPIVLATPHLGAWELCATVSMFCPEIQPLAGSYRPLDHPGLDAYVRAARERFGARMLSRKEGFNEAMRLLRAGGAFDILFDQNAGDRGELTMFFDRVCSSTNLPGLLATKFDASLVVLFTRRLGFWRYELDLLPLSDAPCDPGGITQYLDHWLENLLRTDEELCGTWLWLHNRWKTQQEPSRRFRLEHKRVLLPRDKPLPRRTRFFVRMPNWLGDVVMTLPLLRALRQSRPDAALTAIVKPALVPLVERSGLCDEVLPLPPRQQGYFRHFWQMRRRYPDCWILFTNSLRGDLEAWLARCRQRFGMVRPGKSRPLLSHAWHLPRDLDESREHQVRVWERFLRHFGYAGELDLSPVSFGELPSTLTDVGGGSVGLIAGTENLPAKRWPVEHWRELIERLRLAHPDLRIELFGTAADRPVTQAVAEGFDATRVRDHAGATGLLEFAGALRQCRLVISNDTGGMHLANLLGTPLIALFGPTNPVRTGPIFAGPVRVLQPPGCAPTGGASLDGLAPDVVAREALALLAGAR